MEESNHILSGDIHSLRVVKQLVEDYQEAVASCKKAQSEEARLSKELTQVQKNLRETIDSTIKKRRLEISNKFDEVLDKENEKIKKIRSERGKAKANGIKSRIEKETFELSQQNKEIANSIAVTFKTEKVPAFCKSLLFNALYYTKGTVEVLLFALIVILTLLILPVGVYLLLPLEKLPEIPALALVYFIVVVVVIFIYKKIGDVTKHKHDSTLKNIRQLRHRIVSNKKQIKTISEAIRRDHSESAYDLNEYDNQLLLLKKEIENMVMEKDQALKTFEELTRSEIQLELENREQEKINLLEAELADMTRQKLQLEAVEKQLGLRLSVDYEVYLGKENTKGPVLEQLISIMETGRAQNVSEALAIYRTKE